MSKGTKVSILKDSISPSNFFSGNYVATAKHSSGTEASARASTREKATERAMEKLADKLAAKRSM
jgi:hypothetical protein